MTIPPRITIPTNPAGPRTGAHADAPGNYELMVKTPASRVRPGGRFEIEVYVTGYGMIETAKLALNHPSDLIDADGSYLDSDIDPQRMTYGGRRHALDGVGAVIGIAGGIRHESWPRADYFPDANANPGARMVLTEIKLGDSAPFALHLGVRRKVRAGEYRFQFVLTYFNGVEWRASTQTVVVVVPGFFERHHTFFTVAGWVVGLPAALVTLGVSVKSILDFLIPLLPGR